MANFFKELLGTSKKKKGGLTGLLGDVLQSAVGTIPVVGDIATGALSRVQQRAAEKNADREARRLNAEVLQSLQGPGFIDNRRDKKDSREVVRRTTASGARQTFVGSAPLASQGW